MLFANETYCEHIADPKVAGNVNGAMLRVIHITTEIDYHIANAHNSDYRLPITVVLLFKQYAFAAFSTR